MNKDIDKLFNSLETNKVNHCIKVSKISRVIASIVGVDVELAGKCGLYHDIGYTMGRESHQSNGFKILNKYGNKVESEVALLHSRSSEFDIGVNNVLKSISIPYSTKIYERIVSTADFLVDSKGRYVTTLGRLEDIINRYGENSNNHIVSLKLKEDADLFLKQYNIRLNLLYRKELNK